MKVHGNGHRWTNQEFKRLIKLWQDDTPVKEIATDLQTTERALSHVITRLRQSGIPLKIRRRGHKLGNTNTPWTQADVEYLVKRREDGATTEQIAVELERSFYGVQAIVLKLKSEGVPVSSFGRGQRRLWDADILRAQIGQKKERNTIPFRNQA